MVLAREKHGIEERDLSAASGTSASFVAFTAQTRMSGVDFQDEGGRREIRKGAADSVASYVQGKGGSFPAEVRAAVEERSPSAARTPLVVASGATVLGVVELKDVVKSGIKERFAELRKMGIKTVMVTGDNPTTAAAIAAEAGGRRFPSPRPRRRTSWRSSASTRPAASSSR